MINLHTLNRRLLLQLYQVIEACDLEQLCRQLLRILNLHSLLLCLLLLSPPRIVLCIVLFYKKHNKIQKILTDA